MKCGTRKLTPVATQEQAVMVGAFAESFGHPKGDYLDPRCPTVILEDEAGMKGYAQISFYPVCFPAFHTQIARPSDVRDFMLMLKGWAQIQHGHYHVAVDEKTNFTPDIMSNLGFEKHGSAIYQPK